VTTRRFVCGQAVCWTFSHGTRYREGMPQTRAGICRNGGFLPHRTIIDGVFDGRFNNFQYECLLPHRPNHRNSEVRRNVRPKENIYEKDSQLTSWLGSETGGAHSGQRVRAPHRSAGKVTLRPLCQSFNRSGQFGNEKSRGNP
jgi:hypothetical protein